MVPEDTEKVGCWEQPWDTCGRGTTLKPDVPRTPHPSRGVPQAVCSLGGCFSCASKQMGFSQLYHQCLGTGPGDRHSSWDSDGHQASISSPTQREPAFLGWA